MALHLINAQPDALAAYQHCCLSLAEGDVILLLEDGVYAALPAYSSRFRELPAETLFALQPDVEARGITALLSNTVKQVDDAGFVALCCAHEKVISWS